MPKDKRDQSCAQFIATMININAGHSSKLMKRCPKLYEYAVFISRIRENMVTSSSMADAIEKAITDCIHDDILAEILRNHKAEVTDMILDEYDENFHIACEKKLSYEEGRAAEKQRAENAILAKNILILHFKNFSDESIAQKLNVSVKIVHDTLKELDSDIAEIIN